MARRPDASERTCVVTRTAMPPAGLIRFVRAPDGSVIPDVAGKLPGRGVWVTGRRPVVEEAVRRKLFARGFKADTIVPADLAATVDRLLADRALKALSMARKAGLVVTGFGKVTSALSRGGVVAVVHAVEAADDGRRKVLQAAMRRARLETGAEADDGEDVAAEWDEDEDEAGDEPGSGAASAEPVAAPAAIARLPRIIRGLFGVEDLDLALGGPNVIHAALLAGGASKSFLNNAAALALYRGGQPETDWVAGSPGSGDAGHPRHDGSFHTEGTATGGADGMTGED